MLAEEGRGSAWWVSVRVQIELALVTSPPACPPQICPNYICNFHILGCSGREIPKCSLVQKCGWLLRRRKEGGTGSPILPFRCLEFSTVYLLGDDQILRWSSLPPQNGLFTLYSVWRAGLEWSAQLVAQSESQQAWPIAPVTMFLRPTDHLTAQL